MEQIDKSSFLPPRLKNILIRSNGDYNVSIYSSNILSEKDLIQFITLIIKATIDHQLLVY